MRTHARTRDQVVIRKELGIVNSFTMEASFAGMDQGTLRGTQLSTRLYEKMGHATCDAILDYCDPDQSKATAALRELRSGGTRWAQDEDPCVRACERASECVRT